MKRSENKEYVSFLLERGIGDSVRKACNQLRMSRSAFVRYCLLKTLQDLSLMSEKVHESEVETK